MKKVAVILGSDSDLPVAERAFEVLRSLGVPFEARVMSAHRTPEAVASFARGARDEGFGAVVALAGKAAHLAGAVAAHTRLPVIGVPVGSPDLGGLDALLSTVQMPSGVPVAAVAIDGAANAAWLAARILAVEDRELAAALEEHAAATAREVARKDAALHERLEETR
ncbi:5-(carboxyamino)imidazole ribonucleotide mutase [Fretibacterium sp. OH1220_COT-178]|uniref:5-(carboxyamino)imidazole ribonucleotide mutase n=1 Tax=Fretibacterium sp. OH1220_COT-178 TaxID=2491047 RepID=UPI000F5FEA50|nr:5-(carboxyamino)imidazole ribonucleotide mutase [Fretibacterium sp. OH1220_COT-178]RRD64965.1 5-(carboxyamino)imidazole ribonucleotide mutase [Fretibacterium sp. OH1220_COT-178]